MYGKLNTNCSFGTVGGASSLYHVVEWRCLAYQAVTTAQWSRHLLRNPEVRGSNPIITDTRINFYESEKVRSRRRNRRKVPWKKGSMEVTVQFCSLNHFLNTAVFLQFPTNSNCILKTCLNYNKTIV